MHQSELHEGKSGGNGFDNRIILVSTQIKINIAHVHQSPQ